MWLSDANHLWLGCWRWRWAGRTEDALEDSSEVCEIKVVTFFVFLNILKPIWTFLGNLKQSKRVNMLFHILYFCTFCFASSNRISYGVVEQYLVPCTFNECHSCLHNKKSYYTNFRVQFPHPVTNVHHVIVVFLSFLQFCGISCVYILTLSFMRNLSSHTLQLQFQIKM